MNICNIVLVIIIVVILGFLILKRKSRENFKTNDFEILAENDNKYKADAYNIEQWYKINKESWKYNQDQTESNNLGYSYKFKEDSRIEYEPLDPFVDNYTVSFLINFKELIKDQAIFYGEESQRENKYMELVLEKQTILKLIFNKGKEKEILILKHDFKLENFYHIAIIYNNSNVTLFLDGQTKTINLNNPYILRSIIFGKNPNNVNYLNGYLGQIGIFKSSLDIDILCDKYEQCNKSSDDRLCDATGKKCNFRASGLTEKMCNDECLKVFGCDQTVCSEICRSCKDPFQCSWIAVEPICKFMPFGRSKLSCVKNCIKNKDCDYLNCDNICSNCDDEINCPWIKDKDRKVNTDEEVYIDPSGKPSPPKISIMPKYKEVSLTIESTYNGDSPVDKYIIFLYKTFNKEEGITINEVNKYPNKIETLTEVKSLNPNETYSIGVRAHNNKGVGKISKIETFKPNHKILQTEDIDIDSLFEDNINYKSDENMDYEYCNN